jgi:lysozyme
MSIAERPARVRTLAVAAAALLAAFALVRFGPEIEVAVLGYEVTGVDVSSHQGTIDWTALAGSGAAFAYIKASEGAAHVDRAFEANWRGAKAAGLARGAYHFFTLCQPGLAQARHFLGAVDARGELPPALDAEHMGPCRRGPTMDDPAREILVFLDEVERISGQRPIVYTTRRFHEAHLKGRLAGERFWIASIGAPPQVRRDEWIFWQFDHSGRRPGVAGPIDLNVYRGSKRSFAAFLNDAARRDGRSRATPPDP